MKIEISDKHRVMRDGLREFLRKECPEEYTASVDNGHSFPEDAWRKFAKGEWLGWSIAEKYGGSGGDLLGTTLIVEELCRGCLPLGIAYVNSTYAASYSFGLYGTESQREELLPALAEGRARFSFAMSEPGGGQDVLSAMATVADEHGGRFRIDGRKTYVTHAGVSDYLIVLTRTSEGEKPSRGLTMFLVDADAPGIQIEPFDSIVLHANGAADVVFDGVEVGPERIVGERDNAWRGMVLTLDIEKVITAAEAIGNAQAALDYAVAYASRREAFGGPIGRFQSLQHYVAEAATRIEAARLLTYKAATLWDAGEPMAMEALMCKLAASEAGIYTTDAGMRLMAGYGYRQDHPMQRHFRDSRIFLTGPVTNEMACNQIAERLGLPRSY
jgi:alkylation response protein AidB-like acyl-CoA dehydrogenase